MDRVQLYIHNDIFQAFICVNFNDFGFIGV